MRKQLKLKNEIVVAAGVVLAMTMFACKSNNDQPQSMSTAAAAAAPSTQPVMANMFGPLPEKGGAQLWAENCNRCHYAPAPDRYSDAQWDVVVHHMRMRANLTGEEARQIAVFLKSAN